MKLEIINLKNQINLSGDQDGSRNYHLGKYYENTEKKIALAIFYYFKSFKINNYYPTLLEIILLFKESNKHQAAERVSVFLSKKLNSKILKYFLLISIFPIVYENEDERELIKNKFKKNIINLKKEIEKYKKIKISDLEFFIINKINLFSLPYLLEDVRDYNIIYSNCLRKIYEARGFSPSFKIQKKNQKKKIGFYTQFIHSTHSVMKLFQNHIIKLAQYSSFEIFFFTNNIRSKTDLDNFHKIKIFRIEEIDTLAHQIIELNLDFLIYLDVGMSTNSNIYSLFKLAKKQGCFWGHPVTTGSKNIDYFFSSELMEVKNSENHYLEKLVKFNNTGMSFNTTHLDKFLEKQKDNINDKFDSKVKKLFVLQNIEKISPQHDELYNNILNASNDNIKLNFIITRNNYCLMDIKRRFKKNINKFNSIDFFSELDLDKFLSHVSTSYLALDTINWSGGNTHLEALYFNVPVVSMRGSFMRNNHSSAFLEVLDLEELIAKDIDDYNDIVLKLIKDEKYYSAIRNKIKLNKHRLYKNNLDDFIEFITKETNCI